MQINSTNSYNQPAQQTSFGAKFDKELTRQFRGLLGDFLRKGDVDSFEKSTSKIRDLKKLCPNGELMVKNSPTTISGQGVCYKDTIILRRPDYSDVKLSNEEISTFDVLCNLTNKLKRIAFNSNEKNYKYSDKQIKEILDETLPINPK